MRFHASQIDHRVRAIATACVAIAVLAAAQLPIDARARQQPAAGSLPARTCRIQGHVTAGSTPLPGATVTAKAGERSAAVTSTDVDGGYVLALVPGTYAIHVDLTAFAPVVRDVAFDPMCVATVDVGLTLASRVAGGELPPPPA